jgi:hypothetical protein
MLQADKCPECRAWTSSADTPRSNVAELVDSIPDGNPPDEGWSPHLTPIVDSQQSDKNTRG